MRALRRLGHRVTFVDNQGYAPALKAIEAAPVDERARASARVDLFLRGVGRDPPRAARGAAAAGAVPGAGAGGARQRLDDLRAANIPSVFWFVEDFRVFTYWPSAVRRFDHVWTIQRGELHQRLAAAGHPSFDYVPTACDPELHRRYAPDETRAYAAAVSFAGSAYPNRRKLLAELCALGVDDRGSPHRARRRAAPLGPALLARAGAGGGGRRPGSTASCRTRRWRGSSRRRRST